MWPTRQQTPMQLAGTAVRGLMVYTLTLIAVMLTWHRWLRPAIQPSGMFIHYVVVPVLALLVFASGVVIVFRAMSLLRSGIRAGRWQTAELAPLRRQIDRPIWMAMIFVAVTLIICVPLGVQKAFIPLWMFLWLPLNLIGMLRTAMREAFPPSSRMFELNGGGHARRS